MTKQDVLTEMQRILQTHDAALASVKAAHEAIKVYLNAHDEMLLKAIETNRAAMRLLNRVIDEGLTGD